MYRIQAGNFVQSRKLLLLLTTPIGRIQRKAQAAMSGLCIFQCGNFVWPPAAPRKRPKFIVVTVRIP